jgi:hypothetical protein
MLNVIHYSLLKIPEREFRDFYFIYSSVYEADKKSIWTAVSLAAVAQICNTLSSRVVVPEVYKMFFCFFKPEIVTLSCDFCSFVRILTWKYIY